MSDVVDKEMLLVNMLDVREFQADELTAEVAADVAAEVADEIAVEVDEAE